MGFMVTKLSHSHQFMSQVLRYTFGAYIKIGSLLKSTVAISTKMISRACMIVLFAFIAPSTGFAFEGSVESKIPVYCNAQSGAFFISAVPADRPKVQSKFQKHRLNWIRLLKLGPQKNVLGDPLKTGTRVKTFLCGPITIKYSSGFLNSNPQGELGALNFPVIAVWKGKQVLLPSTALEECDVNLGRYEYFDLCPNGWARSIMVEPTSKGLTIEVKRTFTDGNYDKIERTDVYR
jgi:hypothetical protein